MTDLNIIEVYQKCKQQMIELDEHDIESKLIVSHVMDIELNDIYTKKDQKTTKRQRYRIKRLCRKRLKGVPIQYLLGQTEFYGYRFLCKPSVLIPRSETEILCEKALSVITEHATVLDLCTGSGCIGITLKKQMPTLNVVCSDKSMGALRVAQRNAKLNNADVRLIRSDLFKNIKDQFDVIVCNPPYINQRDYKSLEKKVVHYEPKMALYGGKNGVELIVCIIKQAYGKQKENGYLIMEIGYDQGEVVKAMLQKFGYDQVEVLPDYSGFDRIVVARKK